MADHQGCLSGPVVGARATWPFDFAGQKLERHGRGFGERFTGLCDQDSVLKFAWRRADLLLENVTEVVPVAPGFEGQSIEIVRLVEVFLEVIDGSPDRRRAALGKDYWTVTFG